MIVDPDKPLRAQLLEMARVEFQHCVDRKRAEYRSALLAKGYSDDDVLAIFDLNAPHILAAWGDVQREVTIRAMLVEAQLG